MHELDYSVIHPSWRAHIQRALQKMDAHYLENLIHSSNWLPGQQKIFNAFSLPLEKVQFVLFGESPYPRAESANGFAFWDAAVTDLWSDTGLAKKVNRATSLRNILKMLLVAEGALQPDNCSQDAIAALDKSTYVQTNHEFFTNLLNHGFLLLNATLVLRENQSPNIDAKAWLPFVKEILQVIQTSRPEARLILLGNIAQAIYPLIEKDRNEIFHAEHPYNLSFITNQTVLNFFRSLCLLQPCSINLEMIKNAI